MPAVVIPLNPEGMGIGEWVILFPENFEGMGMGMGMGMANSKKLCVSTTFFLESLASRTVANWVSFDFNDSYSCC